LLASRRDDADDVVQEALMRAHRALRRDDRPMALAPWLYTLTRNCCLDELSRRHATSVELDAPIAQLALVDASSPDVVAEQRAGVRDMLDGIAGLPTAQRHALIRREVDGASHGDIAAELGISPLACRSLVFRARQTLIAEGGLSDGERCEVARQDLLRAHHAGARATARTHRHLVACASCRAYRSRVRALRHALHSLHPGLGLVFVALAIKGGAASGKATGLLAGGAAKTTAGTAGLVAALAVGGTLIIAAGQPSPLTITSPVVPGGQVRAGAPLPAGTAVVTRRVVLNNGRAAVPVACPAGLRVADLLTPNDAGVTAAYRNGPAHGASRDAIVDVAGRPLAHIGVSILCRRPDATGALVADGRKADAAERRSIATVCVRHAFLRDRPGGAAHGSVGLGEPVKSERRRGSWREVQTQFGAHGWLPVRATCG
jgi:RNA polymerase sigma factor (sigma-70 family)